MIEVHMLVLIVLVLMVFSLVGVVIMQDKLISEMGRFICDVVETCTDESLFETIKNIEKEIEDERL